MTLKQGIVAELGQSHLLVPDLIARSLMANDRVKYYFALLQAARNNADEPRLPVMDLKSERLASGVSDAFLDDVVAGAKKDRKLDYAIPHAQEIVKRIKGAIAQMLDCLSPDERRGFEDRFLHHEVTTDGDRISGAQIDAMTSGDRKAGDSLHLVVMDAHRAINALQSKVATETIDGAQVYQLSSRLRPLVTAFMRGVNRTCSFEVRAPRTWHHGDRACGQAAHSK